jgi:hypothetical protein
MCIKHLNLHHSAEDATAPFIKAYASLGIPKEPDGSGGRALNTFWAPVSIHGANKTRQTARNYVELAISRPNYHVIAGRQVTRLITEKTGYSIKVTGVEVRILWRTMVIRLTLQVLFWG